MPNSIRAFVAVAIPPNRALRNILDQLGILGSAIKPVSVDNLHVTLKFLGQVSAAQVPRIVTAMQNATDGEAAFTAQIVGLGVFPRPERPSVVWAGLDKADGLIRIADQIEEHLATLGFPRERRSFHPHLTLARVRKKPPAGLADLLQNSQATPFGSVNVRTIRLFLSEPGPTGPRYSPLATANLSSTVG